MSAVKVPAIVELLIKKKVYVDVILTESAAFFQHVEYNDSTPWAKLQELCTLHDEDGTPWAEVWRDEDEWNDFQEGASPTHNIIRRFVSQHL